MASSLRLSLLLLAAWAATCAAQKAAPGPAPAGPLNLTGILDKAGQFTTFIRLLTATQVGEQVDNQVNHSSQGMTVFAPTDNAFQNLKPGLLNSLTTQQQVQLILFHVLPQFYKFDDFQTATNPVRTQATGNDGKAFGLTITYLGVNQVNVSSGTVTTQVNNALRDTQPLAIYQVDKVLVPKELFAKAPESSPAPTKAKSSDDAKAATSPTGSAAADKEKSAAYGVKSMGLGFVASIGLITMAILF